jgi:hypothetical protein
MKPTYGVTKYNLQADEYYNVMSLDTSGFKCKNTDGQMVCCRHKLGRGEAESTPVETVLSVKSAKRVVEAGSLGV